MSGRVVMLEAASSVPASGLSNAYAALTTPKERVDFLVEVLTKLRDGAGAASQNAVTAAQSVGEQYAWAKRQEPPIDLDAVDRALLSLPVWLKQLEGADAPPRSLDTAIRNGSVDRVMYGVGLTADAVLPGASEPRGGRRRRKTRKTRKAKRKTLRRRR
jgi:hypothetical protein